MLSRIVPSIGVSINKAAMRMTPSLSMSRRCFSSESSDEPIKTALYDLHVDLGGKMVPFAGYSLPVQYKDSLIDSHKHCRSSASIFDVSHMGQIEVRGPDAVKFVERLVVGDIAGLNEGEARLSLITNENGGIIDDTIITNKGDHIFMVVNGAVKHSDMAHMKQHIGDFDAEMTYLEDRSLIALQGPKAMDVLSRHIQPDIDLVKLPFMYAKDCKVAGVDCFVTRCGYTGEDGFEISFPDSQAVAVTQTLLGEAEVLPAALGVRDSLRLEAGLCLYGHDLDETITPVEAALTWCIGKRRREEANFIGADVIMKQIKAKKVERKRVGLEILGGAPAREGAEILDLKGNKIGDVTSGTFSPSLGKKVSMGYVDWDHRKNGTEVQVRQRNRTNPAVISKMPFVPASYYKVPE